MEIPIIIRNNILPPKGYKAITIFPFIFVRKKIRAPFGSVDLNHEKIHCQQEKELLLIFFYIFYILEYILNIFKYQNLKKAYRNISFEKEAYSHQEDFNYLKNRKIFNQWRNE